MSTAQADMDDKLRNRGLPTVRENRTVSPWDDQHRRKDAAERARAAIGLSAGPDMLAAVAATIRQADQAARQDERIQIDKPLVSEGFLDSLLGKETHPVDPIDRRNERAEDAAKEILRLRQRLVDERRKVLEAWQYLHRITGLVLPVIPADWVEVRSEVQKAFDTALAKVRALAEEVT